MNAASSSHCVLIMSVSRHGSVTPPPNGRSPSPFFTPLAGGEQDAYDSSYDAEMHSIEPGGDYELESVQCQWLDCRQPFSELQALINHIHDGRHDSANVESFAVPDEPSLQTISG